jgi:hypothetical protein
MDLNERRRLVVSHAVAAAIVQDLGFEVQGSGFRVYGSGFGVQDLGFRV